MSKKSDKFKELARSRVNRAINMIRLIANLGNKAHYDIHLIKRERLFLPYKLRSIMLKLNLILKKEAQRNSPYEPKFEWGN